MKKLILTSAITAMAFSLPLAAEQPYMSSYLEKGLVNICKTAAQDKMYHMNKAIDELRLKRKTVALNVVCNGQDIIAFAERYGAEKTSRVLSDSVGRVEVRDIVTASSQKWDVSFDFNAK